MATDSRPAFSDPWDRVASELRACKESQLRAWGDVDNATLGRYLAGEVTGDELVRVESALDALPELRKLTDLVRDVLGEAAYEGPTVREGAASSAESVAPSLTVGPRKGAVLPFKTVLPPRPRRLSFTARHASLAAAACVLVVVGAALPRSAFEASSRQAETRVALPDGVAMNAMVAAPAERVGPRLRSKRDEVRAKTFSRATARNVNVVRQQVHPVPPPMADTVTTERDVTLTPHQAVALHREGYRYRFQGDLARAEESLVKAHFFCLKNCGPEHPATKSSGKHLAQVYNLAFNTGAASRKELADSAHVLRERLANQPISDIKTHVIPVLTKAWQSAPAVEDRRAFVRALGQLGPAAEQVVPMLTAKLKEASDPGEVRELLLALEQMGEAAQMAVPALTELSGQNAQTMMAMAPAAVAPRNPKPKAVPEQKVGDQERQLAARVLDRLQGCEGRVGVRDEAGCFTLRTVRASCDQLARLAKTSGVEVLVETSKGTTPETLTKMGPRAIHVVIDPTGPTVHVALSKDLEREGFPSEKLRTQVQQWCGKRQFDRALADGVRVIRGQVAGKKK